MTIEKKILICLKNHPILSAKVIADHINDTRFKVLRCLVRLVHDGKVTKHKGVLLPGDNIEEAEKRFLEKYSLAKQANVIQQQLF